MTPQTLPIPFPLHTRGKVRDVYDLGDRLLIVASDRVSAYDFILPTPIPSKGALLTQMSNFWFDFLSPLCSHHLVADNVNDFPKDLLPFKDQLQGRSVLVKKAKRVDVECVVRAYLAGSGWKEYQETHSVCGVALPEGLRESSQLPHPIFTPATKAPEGLHDENVSFDVVARSIGHDLAQKIKDLSLSLFSAASAHAAQKGFLLADTKFEFGLLDGQVILIDEALTPDSSRFWEAATYEEGRPQDSFDKQFVRDYLNKIQWNRQPPVPELPPEVVERTLHKYRAAFERITGHYFTS